MSGDTAEESFAALLGHAMSGPLERGMHLAGQGAVEVVESLAGVASARVRGTSVYRVVLTAAGSASWSCSCPAAADGSFCKHCVATACIVGGVVVAPSESNAAEDSAESGKVEQYVRSLSQDALVTIVLDQVQADSGLSNRLLAEAMAGEGGAIDVPEWRKKITAAFSAGGGHIERRRAAEWARGVHDILDSLWSFLGAGHASAVASLAEHAHRRNESAVNRVDDSGGEIVDIMGAIAEIHYAAAEAGAYRPRKLGARLAELELKADLDTFHRSAITYAEFLGEEGLAAYEKVLRKVAPDGPRGRLYGEGFRVRQAYLAHAVALQDPDRLAGLLEGMDAIAPSEYVELVKLFMAVGRVDEAEVWADRGLETDDRYRDWSALREVRAELLRTAPGGGEAVEDLYWAEYERRASARTVRDLLRHAVDESSMRERISAGVETALAGFREVPHRDRSEYRARGEVDLPVGSIGAGVPFFLPRDAQFDGPDAVISVLLELGEVERAWSVAMEFGAWSRTWDELVKLRVADHPRDTLAWALVRAEMEIDHRDRRHYKRAVRVLREAQEMAVERSSATEDLAGDFHLAIIELLTPHRNKPSLVDEFEKEGWA